MNENICKLGRLLFGERWVPQAAHAVNFSTPRYMQRVAAGTHPISNGAARDLIKYAKQHQIELADAIQNAEREYSDN